jgi:hypothetical protein
MTPLESYDQAVRQFFKELREVSDVDAEVWQEYQNIFQNIRALYLAKNYKGFMHARDIWMRYISDACHEQPSAFIAIDKAIYRMRDVLRTDAP